MENSFAVAAKITQFDGKSESTSIEDESYGTVQFWIKWWDGSGVNFQRLKDRPCTAEDYSNDFFPLHSRFEGLGELKNQMKCI